MRGLHDGQTSHEWRQFRQTAVDAGPLATASQVEERLSVGVAYNRNPELVFVDEIGDPLRPARISATFRTLVKAKGFPPLTLHGLRHTFATVGLDAGVDVLYIAEFLGHSSPAITQEIYQHTRPERKAEAVARIGAAIYDDRNAADGQTTGRQTPSGD